MYLVDAPVRKIEQKPHNEAEKEAVSSWASESIIF